MNQEKCCEKCEGYTRSNENLTDFIIPICINPSCPCHTSPKEETTYDKISKFADDMAEKCASKAFDYPSPKVASWEDRFDKKWAELFENDSWPMIGVELKSFISSTIKEERERIIKEVKAKGLHLGYANPIIDIINNQI
jgi:hypothetical protein